MKCIAYVGTLAVALVLTACSESTPVQTVDWYKEHDAERAEMVAECRQNAGDIAASPNCINAVQAEKELANARRGHLELNAAEFSKELKRSN